MNGNRQYGHLTAKVSRKLNAIGQLMDAGLVLVNVDARTVHLRPDYLELLLSNPDINTILKGFELYFYLKDPFDYPNSRGILFFAEGQSARFAEIDTNGRFYRFPKAQ